MDIVDHSTISKAIIPFGMIFGAIVPYRVKNVPIQVHYSSNPENPNPYWDRIFYLRNGKKFRFKSHMKHLEGNEVIEFVRFG